MAGQRRTIPTVCKRPLYTDNAALRERSHTPIPDLQSGLLIKRYPPSMTTVDHQFQHPLATLTLKRWPRRRNERLRAWDGADMLLLDACAALGEQQPVLVGNDPCGALALPLGAAGRHVISSGDSWLAWRAMMKNAEDNDLELGELEWNWPWQS